MANCLDRQYRPLTAQKASIPHLGRMKLRVSFWRRKPSCWSQGDFCKVQHFWHQNDDFEESRHQQPGWRPSGGGLHRLLGTQPHHIWSWSSRTFWAEAPCVLIFGQKASILTFFHFAISWPKFSKSDFWLFWKWFSWRSWSIFEMPSSFSGAKPDLYIFSHPKKHFSGAPQFRNFRIWRRVFLQILKLPVPS